jgi:hypothetical protein
MTARKKFTDEEHEQHVVGKRQRRMDMVDNYPPAVRSLVHEYGLNIVKAFLDHGVTRPNIIKHLIETVLNDFSPTRASYSLQGVPKDVNRAAMTETIGLKALSSGERTE